MIICFFPQFFFVSPEDLSDGIPSPPDLHPLSNMKQFILSCASRLVSNVHEPVGVVCLLYVMWSANYLSGTHIPKMEATGMAQPLMNAALC